MKTYKKSLRFILALVMGMFFRTVESEASVITYTSRVGWETAVSGSSIFNEDFESFLVDTEFRTVTVDVGHFTLRQIGTGLSFRNLIEAPPFEYEDNNGTKHASMFTEFDSPIKVEMAFHHPIFAWGANFYDASENEKLNLDLVLDMGGVITTIPVPVNTGFFGFVTSPQENVGKLIFKSRTSLTAGEGFGLDNISGAVPEPVTVLLLGLGGLGLLRKRRA